MRKKLDEVANGKDAADCFKEPSERVRRMARMVLAACGGYQPGDSPVPTEGPTPAPPAAIEGPTPAPALGLPPPDGAAPPAAPAAAPGSSASTEPAHLRGLSPVQLVSFEQAATTASAYDPAVARIDGEPIFESRVLPWAEAEAARRRAAGAVIDGPAFARILAEQVERAVDARLFLLQAHRESAAAGRPPGPLGPDEVEHWLRRKLAVDPYVSVAETEAYHRAHRDRFRAPAQVRWEQISTSVAEAGSRERALELMKYFRDRIAGVDVDPPAVDLRAAFTTTYDYTPLDRIEPAIVAGAAATLPVGAAGAVLEERGEFFLVRVLDRRPGAEPPFDELAGRIRSEITARRRREAEAALLAQLRREHEVWTAHGGTVPAEVGGVVPAAARVEPPSATGLDGEPAADVAPLGFDAPPQPAELDAAIAPLRLDHFPNFPQPPVASEVAPRRP